MLFNKENNALVRASRQALKNAEDKAEQLKKGKDITEHNNLILLQENKKLARLLNNIAELATSNNYNREDVILAKIRELVRPLNQN
jgi:hypothetical protein